jgi:PAS domain S-box-containing protein
MNGAGGSMIEEELRQEVESRHEVLLAVEEQLRCQHEELVAAQATLEESRARYVELFDLAPIAYVTLSPSGVITDANLAAATLLNRKRARTRRYPFQIFVAEQERRKFFQHLQHCRQEGGQVVERFTLRRNLKDLFPAQLTTVPAISGLPGRSLGFRTAITDLSDLERAREALQQANEQLERRVDERTAELRNTNRELAAEIAKRRRLEWELLQISEREKRRVGQDLHDGVCQELGGIAMLTQVAARSLQPDHARQAAQLEEITQMMTRLIVETKQIARGLHPTTLRSDGLPVALAELAERFNAVVPCVLKTDSQPELSDEASLALYRIAQEAGNNALRHASAKRLDLRLSCNKSEVILVIEDDGVGLPRGADQKGGMGVDIMGYRASLIGARFVIEPRKPRGTRVACFLPLDAGNPPALRAANDAVIAS